MNITMKSTDGTYDRIIINTPARTDFTEEAGVFSIKSNVTTRTKKQAKISIVNILKTL